MTNEHRLPTSSCLNCGYEMDSAGSPDGGLALCIRCGVVMAYDSSGRLRGMTQTEMDKVVRDHQYMNYLATLVKRIYFVQATKN